MPTRILLGLVVLWSLSMSAADKSTSLDVKTGLWEITQTSQVSGMPPVSAEMLARLPPAQRAKYEERMKERGTQEPKTTTRKHCVTKEELDKETAFSDEEKKCLRTILHSSSDKLEVRLQCVEDDGKKHNEVFRLEAIDPISVKGSIQMITSGGGGTMYINSTLTARWIGKDCPESVEKQPPSTPHH